MTQAAFKLAKERSAAGDRRLENRAAIVALAILLGHTGLEPLVGNVLNDTTRERAGRVMGTAVLQGPADWPRHFLVSAAQASAAPAPGGRGGRGLRAQRLETSVWLILGLLR
jgi:hypothetical protein